jgi:hypothetical protein
MQWLWRIIALQSERFIDLSISDNQTKAARKTKVETANHKKGF